MGERLAQTEASVAYLERDVKSLSSDLRRIEDKADTHHQELSQEISQLRQDLSGDIHKLSQGVRRITWLATGGWVVVSAIGGITLWLVSVGRGLEQIFGS